MLPAGYDLKSLFVFTLVVETGSMTQAAKVLKMTQSSVSQTINNLEHAVSTPLFDRSARPISLTVAGNTLYEKSKRLLTDAGQYLRDTHDSENLTFEVLTLGLAESFANTVGPYLVTQLSHMARKWRILSGTSPAQHEALMNYEVDIILSTSENITPQEGLSIHTVMEEPYVLVFPKSYKTPVNDLSNITDLPFIRYTIRSSIGRQIERQISRLRLHIPESSEFDTATGQLKMVGLGAGWSITTPICLLQEIEQLENINVVAITRGKFSRPLTLIARTAEMDKTLQKIALQSQQILKEQLLPELITKLPWLDKQFIWDFSD